MLEFKQLEALVQVVRHGSFSRAAEALYLTQPTVSAQIAALESELNTQLIVRTPRVVYPSDAGKRLYEYATELLALRDQARTHCSNSRPIMRGTIDIAASTIPYVHVLPKLMADFRAQYPNIRFHLQKGDSSTVVEQIVSGKVDFGMTGAVFDDPICDYFPFMDDDLVVVTPNTPKYRAIQRMEPADLMRHPFLAREPGSGTRKETERYLRSHGVRPELLDIVVQLDDPDAIKHSVSQGLGISILSQLSVADYEAFERVRVFRLGEQAISRKLYLVSHKKRPVSGVALAFLQFVLKISSSYAEQEEKI